MDTAHTVKIDWRQFILAGIGVFVFGFAVFVLGAGILYGWFVAEYTPREFVPYRTTLTQIEPGYSFSPGYPSVTISMSDFRAQSTGKSFILSYPLELNSWQNGLGQVTYLMQKPGVAGSIYIVSSEKIPDFDTNTFGSFGYSEHTAFDSKRVAYVSVKDGISYHAWWSILLLAVGLILAGIGVACTFDSNAPYKAAEHIRRWSRRLNS